MNQVFQSIVSALTLLGLGGILGAYVQAYFQRRNEVDKDAHEIKRKRYGSILIQMLTVIDPLSFSKVQEFRPQFKNIEDIKEEIKTEMLHAVLFASDEVIKAMARFIEEPNHSSYIDAVSAMRKDLWGKNTKVGKDIIKIFSKS